VTTKTIAVVNGNLAAAWAARLSRPDVIAAYPITPQSAVVEYLTQFRIDGDLNCQMSEVESEHTAMSILTGASLTSARCFTATSSQGLALMYEPYFRASTLRLPIVMCIVNREMISPQTVWGGPQDSLSVRDAGWIQIYVEDNQEILDTTIQAFRIGEDKRVLLPVNVCYDGFYLSHLSERVEIPDQADVDRFLPPYHSEHILLDPEKPMAVDPLTSGYLLMEYRQKHLEAQQAALEVIEQVDSEYEAMFGRSWGGLIEEYRVEDADYVVFTLGSVSGAVREMVDVKRDEGIPMGLIKVRSLRPFPRERIVKAMEGKKGFGVIDRNVSFGWNAGILFQEVRSALCTLGRELPCIPFIGGLGGEDITLDLVGDSLDRIVENTEKKLQVEDAVWLWSPRKRVKE
jgi:pyruvate ferredoxin oxidoreductase alpha subunit/phenylglyoxylate dehydrogenase alpha subunit